MLDVRAMDTKTITEQNGGFVPAVAASSAMIAAIPVVTLGLVATVTLVAVEISSMFSNLKESPPATKV